MSELKKISAYVPKEIYECLEKDKQEGEISLSQVIIAALANHYNIEVTVGKSGRRVTLGGETATAERVNALEQKFEQFSFNVSTQIEQILSAVQNNNRAINRNNIDYEQSTSSNGAVKNQSIDKILDSSIKDLPSKIAVAETTDRNQQLALLDIKNDFGSISRKLLGLRLNTSPTSISNKKKKPIKEFIAWSSQKDPDLIAWIFSSDGTGYVPSRETTEDKLLKLKTWIAANT